MRSIAPKIGFVLLILMCTSCFEIKEILNLEKDGTGTYQFIVDLSQSKAMLAMLENMGEEDSTTTKESPFNEMDKSFDETRERLEAIEGIINVNSIKNEENLQFGVQFEFLTIYALNKALNRIDLDKEKKMQTEEIFFALTNKNRTFERYNTENFTQDLMKNSGMGEGDSLNISMFFKDLSYTTKYTMPKKVKSMTNPDASLSDDKKTVNVTYYPFRGEGEPNFSNKIKF